MVYPNLFQENKDGDILFNEFFNDLTQIITIHMENNYLGLTQFN